MEPTNTTTADDDWHSLPEAGRNETRTQGDMTTQQSRNGKRKHNKLQQHLANRSLKKGRVSVQIGSLEAQTIAIVEEIRQLNSSMQELLNKSRITQNRDQNRDTDDTNARSLEPRVMDFDLTAVEQYWKHLSSLEVDVLFDVFIYWYQIYDGPAQMKFHKLENFLHSADNPSEDAAVVSVESTLVLRDEKTSVPKEIPWRHIIGHNQEEQLIKQIHKYYVPLRQRWSQAVSKQYGPDGPETFENCIICSPKFKVGSAKEVAVFLHTGHCSRNGSHFTRLRMFRTQVGLFKQFTVENLVRPKTEYTVRSTSSCKNKHTITMLLGKRTLTHG